MKYQSGFPGFPGLLTLLFIGLKLTNVIDWSWVWVLSPIWITFGIGIVIFLVWLVLWIWANCFTGRRW